MNEDNREVVIRKKINIHPITAFILLSLGTIIVSEIIHLLGVQATYTKINPITKELQPYIITVTPLFNTEGIRYIISNVTRNFITFVPLSIVLIFLISLGVAKESGLLKCVITKITKKMNRKTITFLLILLGIIFNFFNETAYIILMPLGALIFLLNGRNPLIGIVASFAAVASSFSIKTLLTSIDISIIHYTNMAARIIDPMYQVNINANLFIILVAVPLLAFTGTIITERVITKKLGKYTIPEEENLDITEKDRRRGFLFASIAFVTSILIIGYMLIPGLPFSGLLLDNSEINYLQKLYSNNSYFHDSIPFIISAIFFVTGLFFGIGAKTFKNDRDVANAMGSYMKVLGNVIILLFFAAQFISLFRETNLGIIIAAWGADLIKNCNFLGIPLIITTLIIISIMNLFLTSPTTKWSIISPIIVPTLMQLNVTPEFSQMILKVGDSVTNGITPLLPFFVVFVGFLNYYNKNNKQPISIKKALSLTIPYSITYLLFWLLMLVGWYMIGLPIGPGVYPTV